jgi:hypothetical protein
MPSSTHSALRHGVILVLQSINRTAPVPEAVMLPVLLASDGRYSP